MSKVYVVQRPSIKVDGEWKDKYDLSPARVFGDLVDCVAPGNVPQDLSGTWRTLRAALQDFTADDCLLAVGDPVTIAAAIFVLADSGLPRLRLLKWDRRCSRYIIRTVERAQNDGSRA